MSINTKRGIEKEIISLLLHKSDAKEKWGIYNLGVRVNVGTARIYNSRGMARRRLIDTTWIPNKYFKDLPSLKDYGTNYKGYVAEYARIYKEAKTEIIDGLIEKGLIEIRKLNDVSPLFPYNIIKDKEVADRIAKMIAASDGELFDLALTIVEEIKK